LLVRSQAVEQTQADEKWAIRDCAIQRFIIRRTSFRILTYYYHLTILIIMKLGPKPIIENAFQLLELLAHVHI
jgi:hypothetical protein